MRIVLANKFLYARGGAERGVLTLGEALQRRGHDVWYFGMQDPRNQVPTDRSAVVRARDYHRPGWKRFVDAASMIYSLEVRRAFQRLLRVARPHVIHAHNIYHQLTPSILDAARQAGVPVVMTLHDYKLVCPRYDLLRAGKPCLACVVEGPLACVRYRCVRDSWLRSAWLAGESLVHRVAGAYDGVACFVAPSRFLRRTMVAGGWPRERLRVIPNFAVSDERPSPAGGEPGRFVFAGRLSPEKGLPTLLQAVRNLDRGRLVVCGRGPLESLVRDAAARHPERVEYTGHLETPALQRELVRAQFTVCPSEWFENAPFAILESMAAGRAVLASRIGGIPELVQNGVNGELLPAADVAAWSRGLARALTEASRWGALGRRAAEDARTRFALPAHVDRIECLYAEVQG